MHLFSQEPGVQCDDRMQTQGECKQSAFKQKSRASCVFTHNQIRIAISTTLPRNLNSSRVSGHNLFIYLKTASDGERKDNKKEAQTRFFSVVENAREMRMKIFHGKSRRKTRFVARVYIRFKGI